jgi:hypothetical protein
VEKLQRAGDCRTDFIDRVKLLLLKGKRKRRTVAWELPGWN